MGTMLAINGQVINSQEPLPIPVDYDYLGETTGTTEIEIPKGYNEVYCDIIDSSSNTYYNTSFIADFDSRTRRGGYYFNASNYGGWIITWNSSTRKAKLTSAQSVGHDYTSTAKVKWYAMKHIVQSGGASRSLIGSSSASGTNAAKIAEIKTLFDGLTTIQKLNAVIVISGSIYSILDISGIFVENLATATSYVSHIMNLSSNSITKYSEGTYVDESSDTNAFAFELYA